MEHVFLLKGRVVRIDESDAGLVEQFHWCLSGARGRDYAVGYRKDAPRKGQSLVYLHRLLTGAPRGAIVDHINGDPLDNRRVNLRMCSQSDNVMNRRNTHGRSPLLGAQWCGRAKPWESSIQVGGKRKRLGRFATAEEAHEAYCAASQAMRGDFSPV